MKCCNIVNTDDTAIQKISTFDKKDASNAMGIIPLPNIQRKQDLTMLNAMLNVIIL